MNTDVLSSIHELAARTVDGLHVRLLWSAVERPGVGVGDRRQARSDRERAGPQESERA